MSAPWDLGQTFSIVHDNLSTIQKARGRDIIVLFGVSQCGKSTTINALRGLKFAWNRASGVPKLTLISTLSGFPLAQMGEGNDAGTTVPAVYDEIVPRSCADDEYCFVFVDSRGSHEMLGDAAEEEIAAASVLLDAIIRNARSVRMVALAGWNYLESLPDCGRLIKSIGKLIRNDTAPIFWLFNRHPATSAQAGKQLDEALWAAIIGEAEQRIDDHFDGIQPTLGTVAAKFGPKSKQAKKLELTRAGIQSLKTARISKRVGYIDPTSDWSIRRLRKQLAALQDVPLDHLNIGETRNPHMHVFTENLLKFVIEEISALDGYLSFAQYKISSIPQADAIIDFINSPQQVADIEQRARARIAEINAKILAKYEKVTSLTGKREILHDPDPFHEECGFFKWWRYARVTLPDRYKNVTAWTVVEKLDPGTSVSEVLANSFPDFDVWYVSKFATDCGGKVTFYVESHHRFTTRDQIDKLTREIRACETEKQEVLPELTKAVAQKAEKVVERNIEDIRIASARVEDLFKNGLRESAYCKVDAVIKSVYSPKAPNPKLQEFMEKFPEQQAARPNAQKTQIKSVDIGILGPKARSWMSSFK